MPGKAGLIFGNLIYYSQMYLIPYPDLVLESKKVQFYMYMQVLTSYSNCQRAQETMIILHESSYFLLCTVHKYQRFLPEVLGKKCTRTLVCSSSLVQWRMCHLNGIFSLTLSPYGRHVDKLRKLIFYFIVYLLQYSLIMASLKNLVKLNNILFPFIIRRNSERFHIIYFNVRTYDYTCHIDPKGM